MPLYRHIIGTRISGNLVVHIQTTITLLICIKNFQICVQIQAQNVYFLKQLAHV